MEKVDHVEVIMAVRYRDKAHNIVGTSAAQEILKVDLRDFSNLVDIELEDHPLPKGQRLSATRKRKVAAGKIKRTLDRLFRGEIDG
jgi:hypothetical protein